MKKIILSALALVVLASCTKNEEISFATTDSQVLISSSIATRTTGNTWENGDGIGVFMTTNESESFADLGKNVLYTNSAVDGATATFSSTTPLYYPATDDVDFLAYYPYSDKTTSAGVYSVNVATQTDQGAIDLMVEKITDQSKTADAVKMVFDHKLARIALTVKPGGGLVYADLEGMTVTLSGTDTQATYDLTKADDATPSPITLAEKVDAIVMKTANDATNSYVVSAEAIIIPQSVSATLTFSTKDSNTFTATIPSTAFAIGEEYIYTVTINNTEVSISSPTINPWGEGNDDFAPGEEEITAEPYVAS